MLNKKSIALKLCFAVMLFAWSFLTVKSTIDIKSSSYNQIGIIEDLEESENLLINPSFFPLISESPNFLDISFLHTVKYNSFQNSIPNTVAPFLNCERIIAISTFLI